MSFSYILSLLYCSKYKKINFKISDEKQHAAYRKWVAWITLIILLEPHTHTRTQRKKKSFNKTHINE